MKQDEIDAARMQKGSIEAVLRLLPAGLVHEEISEALSRIDARIAQAEENQDETMPMLVPAKNSSSKEATEVISEASQYPLPSARGARQSPRAQQVRGLVFFGCDR
jgi:hypothetical protein